MIELQQLSKHHALGAETVAALAGVDLQVAAGEALAIVGPSGSGKSTLLQLVGLLDSPSGGRYLLEGTDVAGIQGDARARLRNSKIGFVFQRFHLVPRLDALDNVALPMRLGGVGRRERRARAAVLLERVGLADRTGHRPSELSGGQQQRVAIARALAQAPKLLLADEPTGSLDQGSGGEILDLLLELNAEGTTLMVVTHDASLARRLPRGLWMLDGRIERDEVLAAMGPGASSPST